MKTFFEEISLSPRNRTEVVDITRNVEEIVKKSVVTNRLGIIYSVHSTTAIIVNEHEAGLLKDIVKKGRQSFPKGAGWLHDRVDDNADVHLASSFTGPTRIFPVKDGRLIRGTWQTIFLLELDGARARRVIIEVLGE